MKRAPLIFFVITTILFTGLIKSQSEKDISLAHLRSNMEFLSDDLLEGRNSTSRSERIASLYIAKELQKYGVQPFGDDGTYYQNFDLNVAGITAGSGINIISSSEEKFIGNGEDIVYYKRRGLPDTSFSGITAEVIFVGYGITAEEFEYDDYKNLDVKGKIVLAISGLPESDDENFFDSKKHQNYASPSYKRDLAQDKGAVGIMSVASGEWVRYWP